MYIDTCIYTMCIYVHMWTCIHIVWTLFWKQYTVVRITDNFLPPSLPSPSIWKWKLFPLFLLKGSAGILHESHQKMPLFFFPQVNMQRYFYEVKISAFFKDLSSILTSQTLGERCWNICLFLTSHEMLKSSRTQRFLQISCSTKVKQISTIFLQVSSGHCLEFTGFYKQQVLGICFQNTTTQDDSNCLSNIVRPLVSLG